jgi:hypothetical protein
MPSEHRFGDDGTKATRFYKPDDGDDRMNENDEDVVHAGIVSKLKKSRNSGRLCNSPPTGRRMRFGCASNSPNPMVICRDTWTRRVWRIS